jgi:hypothetical protein
MLSPGHKVRRHHSRQGLPRSEHGCTLNKLVNPTRGYFLPPFLIEFCPFQTASYCHRLAFLHNQLPRRPPASRKSIRGCGVRGGIDVRYICSGCLILTYESVINMTNRLHFTCFYCLSSTYQNGSAPRTTDFISLSDSSSPRPPSLPTRQPRPGPSHSIIKPHLSTATPLLLFPSLPSVRPSVRPSFSAKIQTALTPRNVYGPSECFSRWVLS